jgi:hypothetical protein
VHSSYEAILRRSEKAQERSWRWWSTAIAGVLGGGVVLVLARGHPSPFSPIADLPPLLVAALWAFGAAAAWAAWLVERAATWVRFWRLRGLLGRRAHPAQRPSPPPRPAPPIAGGVRQGRRVPEGGRRPAETRSGPAPVAGLGAPLGIAGGDWRG